VDDLPREPPDKRARPRKILIRRDVPTRRAYARVIVLATAIGAVTGLAWYWGAWDLLWVESLDGFKGWIAGYGFWGPVIFICGYAAAELVFVPALPLTVLGGVVFGPVWGTAYVSVGATLGAAGAFLAARYALRGPVERWVEGSPRLRDLDAAVAEQGWRMLVITRLVPLFPFNLQNFAYGLTRMRFRTFVLLSWLCMLPGTAAYTFAGGALVEGRGDLHRTLGYLAVAAVLIVALSFGSRWLRAPEGKPVR
jgi:uncharacterized membrane protein YdjX (TVP38/TMEM64 family)